MLTTHLAVLSAARDAMLTVATLRELFKVPGDVSTVEFFKAYKAGVEVPGTALITIIDELLEAPAEEKAEELTNEEILTELLTPRKKCGFPKGMPRPFIDRVCSVCAAAYKTQQYRLPARCPTCVAAKLHPQPVVDTQPTPVDTQPTPVDTQPTPVDLVAEIRERLDTEQPQSEDMRICTRCNKPFERHGRLGSAKMCKPCHVAVKEEDNVPVVAWPSHKIEGFPCASCVHGKSNQYSDTGYECIVSLGRLCAPWGPAWKHEKKS